jgi:tetratricopeptide (TPR) repeat protein
MILTKRGNCVLAIMLFIAAGLHAQNNSGASFMSLLENARKASTERKWKESVQLWQQIVAINPVHGAYHGQLGDAAYNSMDYPLSIKSYEQQIALGHNRTEIAAYNIACCYALMGDKKNALSWLDRSFRMGYSDFAFAQKDSDLKSLHGDPEFENLVLRIDPSKLNRIEGWRYDLDVLQREIDRKAIKGDQFDPALIRGQINSLKERVPKLTDNEIVLEIIKIMRNLNDGHSWAMPPFESLDFKMTLPLLFYQFKEGLYIIAGDPKYKDIMGSQVTEYAGIPVEKFAGIFDPYISRDNQMSVLTKVPYLLRVPAGLKTLKFIKDASSVDLKLTDIKGNKRTVAVKADTTQPIIWNVLPAPDGWINFPETLTTPMPLYLKDMRTFHWWELMPDKKTVYCQINRIRNAPNQTFSQLAERLFNYIDSAKAEKLVIDLRWNNGGNTMLVMPLIDAIIRHPEINKTGNLFVITGRRTYSAAQNLSTYLERFTNPIFVGEPTGSSPNFVGEEEPLFLPYSKTPINVSDLYWQSSFPFDKRTWIAPLLYTPPSFEYFKSNRDPALEAIQEYIKPGRGF